MQPLFGGGGLSRAPWQYGGSASGRHRRRPDAGSDPLQLDHFRRLTNDVASVRNRSQRIGGLMLSVISTPDQAEPVALRRVDEPAPAPDEALVAIAAFSLNRGELALLE